jgi:lipopolysaccharide export system protein LptA
MEQSGDFTYDEGDRRARGAKGTLDSTQSVMTLQTAARVWDPTGSVTADSIRLNQVTGDFTAEGRVSSSRLPDKDQKTNSGMLTSDQPLQAQAAKMVSTNRNRSIHYEGNSLMWQGANRVQADVINLDREKRTLEALGNVVSNLWEQPDADSGGKAKAPAAPVLTVVRSQRLFYTDSDRLAHYTGKVTLNRTGLNVKSDDLLAYLASGADSRLEKGIAEGSVEIVQTAGGRKRTGTGTHAEYYPADQKIILRGSKAKLGQR